MERRQCVRLLFPKRWPCRTLRRAPRCPGGRLQRWKCGRPSDIAPCSSLSRGEGSILFGWLKRCWVRGPSRGTACRSPRRWPRSTSWKSCAEKFDTDIKTNHNIQVTWQPAALWLANLNFPANFQSRYWSRFCFPNKQTSVKIKMLRKEVTESRWTFI